MNLNKKLIIGLAVVVLLVVAAGGYYFFHTPAVKWTTHTNQEHKFQLEHPADWIIIDGSSAQGDKQFRGVALEGPIHTDLPGYENQEVRYLMILEFKDSFVTEDVKIHFSGFALKKESGEVRPKLAAVSNLEKTPEYQAMEKIIASVKLLP